MRTMFPFDYRVERDHAGGTETVVEHETFTVVFGAYLSCAANDPDHIYRVMHRARVMRSSDADAAVAAFAAMDKGVWRRMEGAEPFSPAAGAAHEAPAR